MLFDVSIFLVATVAFFVVAAPTGGGAAPPERPTPRIREVTCGADIALVDVHPQAREETISIESHDPVPIDLTAWRIVVGRRKVVLDAVIAPFERLTFASPPLRNAGGNATLVDPCGLAIATIDWGTAMELGPVAVR